MRGEINNLYHIVSMSIRDNQVNGVVDKVLKFYINYIIAIPIRDPKPVEKFNLRGGKK